MSRWWSKQFVVGLWPRGITVQDASAEATDSPYSGSWATADVPGELPWTAGINAINRWLSTIAPPRCGIEVRLSSQYAHYLILPWSAALTRESEWKSLAKARVESIWGSQTNWDIRLDRLRFGSSCLACAVDDRLISDLVAMRNSRGLRLRSIQPAFSASFNELATTLQGGSTLLVTSELDCVTIGAVDQGTWNHIRTLPLSSPFSVSADTLVNRERLSLGLPPDCSVVYSQQHDAGLSLSPQ